MLRFISYIFEESRLKLHEKITHPKISMLKCIDRTNFEIFMVNNHFPTTTSTVVNGFMTLGLFSL